MHRIRKLFNLDDLSTPSSGVPRACIYVGQVGNQGSKAAWQQGKIRDTAVNEGCRRGISALAAVIHYWN